MIGIVHTQCCDSQCIGETQVFSIHQDSHHFWNGNGWVCIIQLERVLSIILFLFFYIFRELIPRKASFFERMNHILNCRRYKEVLLFQSQFFSIIGTVVWIENTAYADHILSIVQSRNIVSFIEAR